jgi:recombination protein U
VVILLYPNNVKKEYKKIISHANRGMDLEHLINEANKNYLNNDIAVIYKKPTPITISNVENKNDEIITKGKFKQKSTLDYVGLYKGKYLDFDAKCSLNKTAFPLANIHYHQLEHIKKIIKHGGYAFLIIEINNSFYLLKGEDLLLFINMNERKSIPISYIIEKGYEIKINYNPTLDYIKIIDKVYFEGEDKI